MAQHKKDHPAQHHAPQHPAAHGQLTPPAHGQAETEAESDDDEHDVETAVTAPALAGGRVKTTPPPAPPPAPARSAAPAAAAAQPAAAAGSPDDERVEYRPNRKIHLCAAGPVSLGNWVGRVGNKFVRVYRGAQASSIPEPVVTAMAASGIEVGLITYEELGLRQPPATMLLRR
jgi:hypothetical protein